MSPASSRPTKINVKRIRPILLHNAIIFFSWTHWQLTQKISIMRLQRCWRFNDGTSWAFISRFSIKKRNLFNNEIRVSRFFEIKRATVYRRYYYITRSKICRNDNINNRQSDNAKYINRRTIMFTAWKGIDINQISGKIFYFVLLISGEGYLASELLIIPHDVVQEI